MGTMPERKMWSALQKQFSNASSDPLAEASSSSARGHTIVTAETITRPDSKVPIQVIDQEASEERPDETAQQGVQQAEAITLSWTKTSLGLAYTL